mmetsp:Transcript_10288/g.15701  ORF Transcript_10288/g.15701 Transcript_10288/m.15701 type:complete len:101 (+) Transcript_10288:4239-4541(+)
MNFLALSIMYAHFVNNSLWVLRSKVRFETTLLLDMGCIDGEERHEQRKSVHRIITSIQSIAGDEDDELSSTDNVIEEAKRISDSSTLIALAKGCERFVQV